MKPVRIAIGVCALVAFAVSCSYSRSAPPSTRVPSEFLSALLSDHWLDARSYLADDFLPGRTFGVVEFLKTQHDELARQGIRSIGKVAQAGTRFDFRVVGRTA